MGTLDIRMRSADLGNLGGVASAQTVDHARSAAARNAADAEKVNSLLGGLEAIRKGIVSFDEQDRRRRENDYVAEVQNRFNAYMQGDGTEANPGRWNERPKDLKSWATEIRAEYDRIRAEARKRHGLSDREYDAVANGDAAFGQQWFGRIANRMAETARRNSMESATAVRTSTEQTLATGDGSPELYRQWAQNCIDELDAYGVTDPDVRAAKLRQRGLELCKTGVANYINDKTREATEAGDAGGKVWDDAIAALREGGSDAFFPPNARVEGGDGKSENIVARFVEGSDMEAFRKAALDDLRNGKRRWENAMRAQRAEREQEQVEAFAAEEQEMFKADVPRTEEGEVAYFARQADAYRTLADKADAAGMRERALRYRKVAESLGFRSAGIERQERARREAEAVRAANEAERERIAREGAMREEVYQQTLADFQLGGYAGADGSWTAETASEQQERARRLLTDGRITPSQFRGLMRETGRTFDEEAEQVRSHVLDLAERIAPNAISYNRRTRSFAVRASKDVRPSAPIPDSKGLPGKWAVGDGTQSATYADLARALTLTLRWKEANGKGADEANAYFDRLVDGTVRMQQMATIRENLDYDERVIDDYRRINAMKPNGD